MRAGKLDRRITIQRKTVTASDSGQPVETWAALELRRAASMAPVRGDEPFAREQVVAQQQIEFRIRYSTSVADLSPQDRIVYPALPTDDPAPDQNLLFNILAVNEIGRREGLQIIAQRHSGVVA